jgi:hypothetical protein
MICTECNVDAIESRDILNNSFSVKLGVMSKKYPRRNALDSAMNYMRLLIIQGTLEK